jgi:hypothetical protein
MATTPGALAFIGTISAWAAVRRGGVPVDALTEPAPESAVASPSDLIVVGDCFLRSKDTAKTV